MAEANDVYGSLYQNLIDAGCDTKTTEQCMALVENHYELNWQETFTCRKIMRHKKILRLLWQVPSER